MKKYYLVGKIIRHDVFVTVEWGDGRLSITGVVGPKNDGDSLCPCGQISDYLSDITEYADGWDLDKVRTLQEYWDRWHMHNMRAGSFVQEEYLRNNPISVKYPQSYYQEASKLLENAGLSPDMDGYKYGHAWKYEEVPESVIEFFEGLPQTTRMPERWK
jgi:hypothetical protein